MNIERVLKNAVHAPRRFKNLLLEAHRTGKSMPIAYPVVAAWSAFWLLPFFVLEPEAFDHPDHV